MDGPLAAGPRRRRNPCIRAAGGADSRDAGQGFWRTRSRAWRPALRNSAHRRFQRASTERCLSAGDSAARFGSRSRGNCDGRTRSVTRASGRTRGKLIGVRCFGKVWHTSARRVNQISPVSRCTARAQPARTDRRRRESGSRSAGTMRSSIYNPLRSLSVQLRRRPNWKSIQGDDQRMDMRLTMRGPQPAQIADCTAPASGAGFAGRLIYPSSLSLVDTRVATY